MKYLDYVKTRKATFAIIQELVDNDIQIRKVEDSSVTCKVGCVTIRVSYEMCSCHGGRIFLNADLINVFKEISSPEYDESKGIVDPETELAYYIENSLVTELKEFSKYIYVVVVKYNYGTSQNSEHIYYFKSPQKASAYVLGSKSYRDMEDYIDLAALKDSFEKTHPNTNMKDIVTFIKEEDGKFYFEETSYERKNADSNWVNRRYNKNYIYYVYSKH